MGAKFSKQLDPGEFFEYLFFCPGCRCSHGIRTSSWPEPPGLIEEQKKWFSNKWSWNGNFDSPTVTPSLNVIGKNQKPICHSEITGGQIKFLKDSAHELAGKTVDLPDYYIDDDTDEDVTKQ